MNRIRRTAVLCALGLAVPGARALAQRHAAPADPGAERHSALAMAAARIAPSVVSVNVVRRERSLPRNPWDAFFAPNGVEQVVEGLGSGFVISSDGVILTNQHVTQGADSIVVTFRDGTDLPARLLGEDARTDLAVLQVDTTGLPVAPLGRSQRLAIGDWVIAVGNPYGYLLGNSEPSVTAGVVSALGRDILQGGDERGGLYVDMIQTDAAINPGNSGGPLANAAGEVVGVNTFILTQSGGNVGLGFAIPIERALRVARQIRASGRVRRGWVGVEIAPPARSGAWARQPGVRVQRVAKGGPGALAGIEPGDIVDRANGEPVHNVLNWEKALVDLGIGDTLRLSLRHDGGRDQTVRVLASELPSESAARVTFADLSLITVTPAIQAERQLASTAGALVASVGPETASSTGLQPGDVIVQINNFRVSSADQVTHILQYVRAHNVAIRIYFERDHQLAYADVWASR